MTGERLLPCPFCGGTPYPTEEDGPVGAPIIACRDCGARGGSELEFGVTHNWNTRSLPAALDRVIAEVEKRTAASTGYWGDTPWIDALPALRALRAEHSAGEGE